MPKKCSKEAYEQKVLARISKNHNTRHMNQHVIEHAVRQQSCPPVKSSHENCSKQAFEQKLFARMSKNHNIKHMNTSIIEHTVQKHADTKECYCDDYPSTSFKFPSEIDSACTNYQTITLEQAYAQGGVRNCQVLRLRQSDYITDTETYVVTFRIGLRITSRFEIQPRGKVILEDPLEGARWGAGGLLISGENAHLINHGEIIVEKSIESSSNWATGIECKQGRFDNFGHVHFKGDIVGQSYTYGIYSVGVNLENNGTINFKGEIVGQSNTYGIYGSDVNLENNGTINFQIIRSRSNRARGIYGSDVNLKNNSNGIINFKGDIVGQNETYGIYGFGGNLENNGIINFQGEIVGQSNTYGIRYVNLENNGTINFKGEIVGQSNTYGIGDVNLENNGTINFQIIRSRSNGALGIYTSDPAVNLKNNSNGTINFNGEIVGQSYTYGIYGADGTLENNGTINFQIIRSTSHRAAGIYIQSLTVNNNNNNNGNINFKDNIYGVFNTYGILFVGAGGGTGGLNNSGNINFEQNLISTSSYARGIEIFDNGSNRLTNYSGGNINFNGNAISSDTTSEEVTGIYIGGALNAMTLNEDSLISFNYNATFEPRENPKKVITGAGEIMYNTGTQVQQYYP